MTADEYDAFLMSPGDFIIRTYLPRAAGNFAPLQELPPLIDFAAMGRAGGPISMFAEPEFMAT